VINYDAPGDPEDYIHRIGRTARAATTGTAITLINERDQRKLQNIEKMIGREVPEKALPPELGDAPVFRAPGTFSTGHSSGSRPKGNWKGKGKPRPKSS